MIITALRIQNVASGLESIALTPDAAAIILRNLADDIRTIADIRR